MARRYYSKLISEAFGSLRELLFGGSEGSYVNSVALLVGATAAFWLLRGEVFGMFGIAVIFSVAVLITLVALLLLSAFRARHQFGWGPPAIIILGYGLGAVVYERREWWKEIWRQLRRINEPHEFVLAALFLIGVMLGVFVVRNWAKEQKAFMESISAILGGTFAAGILAKLFENQPGMSQKALAYYAFGFAISGALNLIFAAWLTARYTNRKKISSRAVLDFMYGPERAEVIDKYFLKNFKDDPDYARRCLSAAFEQFLERAKIEFATRMEARRTEREGRGHHFYEMRRILEEEGEKADSDEAKAASKKREYAFVCRRLSEDMPIVASMFRAAVAFKKADLLEYIVAPGEYHAAFPQAASVMGLSLEMRQTIVMDRDQHAKFRNKDHKYGISPAQREQPRGLDEIDYLSYISIPIVSRLGEPTENPLGVFDIDTKIFVSKEPLSNDNQDSFVIHRTRKELTEMASELYDQNDDKVIQYLKDLTKIIEPVMELYARCSIGTA